MVRKTLLAAGTLLASLLAGLAPAIASADPVEIIGFHSDLFADWDEQNERLRLSWRVSDPDYNSGLPTPLAPADGFARIRSGDWVLAPGGWESYGVNAGDPLWIGPADFFPGALYLGFAADLSASAGFSGNVTFTLEALSGPGELILTAFETVVATSAELGPDSLAISRTGHAHFDWLFTQQGLYTLTLGASILKDGETVSVSENFAFHVGIIPEPATASALVGVLALGICVNRRRRDRRRA